MMVLIAGAGLGIGLLPLASATGAPGFGPGGIDIRTLTIGSYAIVSGISMASFILLVANRMTVRRVWGPAAVSLFVAGMTAWLFVPMVATTWVQQSNAFEPFRLLLKIYIAHQPGQFALEAFYHFWPIACLALFIGCNLSGQASGWWALQGWWAEWLGMWILAVWSLPSVPILFIFFRAYFRVGF